MSNRSVVGQSVVRRDATQKVTGQVLHVGNIEMPGLLHVAVLRSPYPHARIARIEKSRAEALDGVVAVLTGADIAALPGIDPYFGPAFRDQPILITAGSRSTYHMGNAVRVAASKIKAELFSAVAAKLEVSTEDLVARDGRISVRGAIERGMTISEAFHAKFGSLGTTITGEAICQTTAAPMDPETGLSEKCTEYWFPSASAAEVEVDTETGQVSVVKFISVGDTGTAINPKHCEQQLLGSATAHLGQTLFEEMRFEEGQILNGSLLDYQIATMKDLPETFEPIVVEVPHGSGPFGAKGVGETGALTVSAAIANAIEDAIGIRVHDLPITPEKILRRLANRIKK